MVHRRLFRSTARFADAFDGTISIAQRLPLWSAKLMTLASVLHLVTMVLLAVTANAAVGQTLQPRLPQLPGQTSQGVPKTTFRPLQPSHATPLTPPSRADLGMARPLLPAPSKLQLPQTQTQTQPQTPSSRATSASSGPLSRSALSPTALKPSGLRPSALSPMPTNGLHPAPPKSPSHENSSLNSPSQSPAAIVANSSQTTAQLLTSNPLNVGQAALRRSTGNLCDVHFLDSKIGIAVGSQGLIWRTTDGGSHWNACVSPRNVDLTSVTFLDKKQGWAVGGVALPVNGLHQGIVLKTDDGGMTWQEIQTTLLPRLVDVQTTADHRLWITAVATEQFPQRIFESLDGGHSWNHLQFQWPKSQQKEFITENNSQTDCVGLSPAWFDGQRSVISTNRGVLSVADDRAIDCGFESPEIETSSLCCISKVGNRLYAISGSGDLLVSLDQGDRWWLGTTGTPQHLTQGVGNFETLVAKGNAFWAVQKHTGRVLHVDLERRIWKWQNLPTNAPIQSMFFLDQNNGWAVGPMGNVLRTTDGGSNWAWQHSLHSNLAVLVVANHSADVPPALIAQLAGNNHLNLGVLVGDSDLPTHVLRDSLGQTSAAWLKVDTAPFDDSIVADRDKAIRGYLSGLRPQILLICPSTHSSSQGAKHLSPVNAKTWINMAQELRRGLPLDRRNPWGIMGQTVQLASVECDSSTSLNAYAPALQMLLGDAAHPVELLQEQWSTRKHTQKTRQDTIGIRRIATAGSNQLSWFSGVARLEPNSVDSFLSRFVGPPRPAAAFNLAQQASYKQSWIGSFAAATTNSQSLRMQWHRNLIESLTQVPAKSRVTWLIELAELCEQQGDSAKTTLAYLEAWNLGNDQPAGLYALTQALPRLISDEVQWQNRIEATQLAHQEMLAMEQRMQAAIENGQTTEEAKMDEALRRWGIDPAEKSQVPPEILAKIEAMEKLRESKSQLQPEQHPESLIEIPNFDTFANVSAPKVRNFEDKSGNTVTKQTTVVQWSTTDSSPSGTVAPASHVAAAPQDLNLTVIDQLPDARIAYAYRMVKFADGLWPHLQSVPQWWKTKAYLAREMGDLPQIDSAWERFSRYQELDADQAAVVQFEKLTASQGNNADPANLFQAGIGGDVKLVSHQYNWSAQWVDQRPNLDGDLSEAIWERSFGKTTQLSIAHDEQYLYLGAKSRARSSNDSQHSGVSQTTRNPRRIVRDSANESDAIRVHIDTDRDYQTDYVICFDSSGRITERQGSNKDWNPTMFVAQSPRSSTSSDPKNEWTIEVAIDLADISLPRLGQYWHVKVERTGDAADSASGWTRIQDLLQVQPQ